jgi:hypothetical protein
VVCAAPGNLKYFTSTPVAQKISPLGSATRLSPPPFRALKPVFGHI